MNFPKEARDEPGDGAGEFGREARQNASLPGLLLIVVGVLNLLGGLGIISVGIYYLQMTAEQFAGMTRNALTDPFLKGVEVDGMTSDGLKELSVRVYFIWGSAALVAGLGVFSGGMTMRSLNHYGLALTGAALAAVPCLSPVGCCGLGQIVGTWALVVLLRPEVRSAFAGGFIQG
jgi:hypothetical protein